MKILILVNRLVIFTAIFFAANSYAVNQPCRRNKMNVYNDLITQVNIVGQPDSNGIIARRDPRRPVREFGRSIGMSQAQIDQTFTSRGWAICPGTLHNNPSQTEASIVADGGIIITSGHAFIDKKGVPREPLSACYFENQTVPYAHVPLKFTKDSFEILTRTPYQDGANDLAFVALEHKIPGAIPYKIDESGNSIQEGQEIIAIYSGRTGPNIATSEPVGQRCAGLKTYQGSEVGQAVILSDCSFKVGDSGALNLVRTSSGELLIKAVMRSGGAPEQDYKPFKAESGARDNSYGFSVGVDRQIVNRIAELQSKQSVKTVSGAPGQTLPVSRESAL